MQPCKAEMRRVICDYQYSSTHQMIQYFQQFISCNHFFSALFYLNMFNVWYIIHSILLISLSKAGRLIQIKTNVHPENPSSSSFCIDWSSFKKKKKKRKRRADVISKIGPWLIKQVFFPNHGYSGILEANLFVDTPGILKRLKANKKGKSAVWCFQEGIIYTPCVQSNDFPIGLKKLRGVWQNSREHSNIIRKA